MRFSWDPDKSEENFRLRAFDFEFATGIWGGPTLERVDDRQAYGERRMIAIGVVQGIELTVVYTDRPHIRGPLERRIISARRSNRHERKAYQAKFKGG